MQLSFVQKTITALNKPQKKRTNHYHPRRKNEMPCKQYVTCLILLTTVLLVNSKKSSGFYIDNGFDQTLIHPMVSKKEKREMEYELLHLFGLPERPRRIARRALLVKRSAPKYLLNIYKNVLSPGQRKLAGNKYNDEFDLSGQDIHVIDQSDLIMTFGAHNPHSGNGSRNNRGKRLWFDVSEVPREEHIIAAELRLYKGINFEELGPNEAYTIAIYRVSKAKSGERIKHYVDSADTTTSHEGWITVNVTQALQYWVNHPKGNRGLFLAVYRIDYGGRILRPDDIGIIGVFGAPDKQPFMVGFFKSTGVRTETFRRKREIRKSVVEFNTVSKYHPYIDHATRRKVKPCNIRTLYVSFKDLQWQDWIIAPEGYDAFYCSGECNFPLNTHMNATNHAIVQTLVHLMKPGKVPKPCCAPTRLSPISVLYFLDDSNVVLKKYKNMVVNSCGCH